MVILRSFISNVILLACHWRNMLFDYALEVGSISVTLSVILIVHLFLLI